MNKVFFFIILLAIAGCKGQAPVPQNSFQLADGEVVWAGVIRDGHLMPVTASYSFDFGGDNKGNQLQPLILTSKGRYFWSENPFSFSVENNTLTITDTTHSVVSGTGGKTLAEVHRYVTAKFMPPSGQMPDPLLFTAPQYNTWIELNYNQNQEDVLRYARAIIENGMPPGVLMIDDTWQEDYGLWDFHPGRFPDPKKMMAELHAMGFKVMLWICPFVSADQYLIFNELIKDKAFLMEKTKPDDTWEKARNPAMIRWWNGVSAVLDYSNPVAVDWFNRQLDRLVADYKVDGFKFDAGDFRFYPANSLSKLNYSPNEHCLSFTQFGFRFPLNEYRACWKTGNQPLAQRLHDKKHSWGDVQELIPHMVIAGLSGYTFSCPDLIGGGLLSTFEDPSKINEELIVRSAQIHALMPMMQFSVAPWRVLSKENFEAVKKAVATRQQFVPVIMELTKKSALTGEPIMSNLEYHFPGQGFERVSDQFMLGTDIMVAPMVDTGTSRNVLFPEGEWLGDDGKTYTGKSTHTIEVSMDRIPYFYKK